MARAKVKIVKLKSNSAMGLVVGAELLANGSIVVVRIDRNGLLNIAALDQKGSERPVLEYLLPPEDQVATTCSTPEAALIQTTSGLAFLVRRRRGGYDGKKIEIAGSQPRRFFSDRASFWGLVTDSSNEMLTRYDISDKGLVATKDCLSRPPDALGECTAVNDRRPNSFLFFDNSTVGVQAWRREGKKWLSVTQDGFGRYAYNGSVSHVLDISSGIIVAVDMGKKVRDVVFGMRASNELVHIGDDGRFTLITGEMRYGVDGLTVPAAGPGGTILIGNDSIAGLTSSVDSVFVATKNHENKVRVMKISSGWSISEIDHASGQVLAFGMPSRRKTPVLVVAG